MRIHILSDLHLEIHPWTPCLRDADVTVLAGDIHRGVRALNWARAQFPGRVLLVAGNHEYWGGHLTDTPAKLRAASCERARFLECDAVVIDGVRFLGMTAWTDYTLDGDPIEASLEAQRWMNDFRQIRAVGRYGRYQRLLPRDLVARNRASRAWLQAQLALPHAGPTVVITHHAPLAACLPGRVPRPLGALESPPDGLDAAYANAWDDLLGPPVALWIYGHTHAAFDRVIRGTRVVSNPRGYAHDAVEGFAAAKVVEIEGVQGGRGPG